MGKTWWLEEPPLQRPEFTAMAVHILHDLPCVTSSALLCQTGPSFQRSQSLPKQHLIWWFRHVSTWGTFHVQTTAGSEGGTEKERALHQGKWSQHLGLAAWLVQWWPVMPCGMFYKLQWDYQNVDSWTCRLKQKVP